MVDEENKNFQFHRKEPSEISPPTKENSTVSLTRATLFLTGVTVASMMCGFGLSLGKARKRSPDAFTTTHNEGVRLAARALGWGTVLAVGGVGALVFGVKTALQVKNAKELGDKLRGILPSKDGKLVSFFESWRLPHRKGSEDEEVESWFADTTETESSKNT